MIGTWLARRRSSIDFPSTAAFVIETSAAPVSEFHSRLSTLSVLFARSASNRGYTHTTLLTQPAYWKGFNIASYHEHGILPPITFAHNHLKQCCNRAEASFCSVTLLHSILCTSIAGSESEVLARCRFTRCVFPFRATNRPFNVSIGMPYRVQTSERVYQQL